MRGSFGGGTGGGTTLARLDLDRDEARAGAGEAPGAPWPRKRPSQDAIGSCSLFA